jgi:hypothetical protein
MSHENSLVTHAFVAHREEMFSKRSLIEENRER